MEGTLNRTVEVQMNYNEYAALRASWLRADSYKYSHAFQLPSGVDGYFGYTEARGSALSLKEIADQKGLIDFLKVPLLLDDELNVHRFPFFGLQAWLKKTLANPVSKDQVEFFATKLAQHGEPFAKDLFLKAVDKTGGFLPVKISALPEGTLTNTRVPLLTVEAEGELAPLGGFAETQYLRSIWYPTTVAGISYSIKQIIKYYLEQTANDNSGLPFKLHDFGMRGVSSEESAEIGGCAHLVNFMGSDTIDALILADFVYNEPMAGYSIPASEHSTMTALGPLREWEQMQRMLTQFPNNSIVACVSDSYDIFNACENIWGGTLRQQVIDSGKTVVVRPDSGDPVEVNARIIEILANKFGTTTNSKGYKVLNHVRIIQGDGVCPQIIAKILQSAMDAGYSADNWAFGMGGALLQKLDRDTFKYAHKCSALRIDGEWRDVYKDPATDPGKRSLRGRVGTFHIGTGVGINKHAAGPLVNGSDSDNLLQLVYDNGRLVREQNFSDIRALANL
jgi:nicotinamide phosphoribosyltransferase